ncbi:hypothetical protein BJF80_14595 [Serinicoccus sp. CUA-874]|uniref:helix-turn-helix domain-containing protein n=1 Tax=Serinicoccus sp. CUA-874 TaxID=1517939 RepID=UPI00096995A7|nr:XRE family transcriptional regulator [Serinicoccus sp. CUA-874]OLT18806.1 hypothetical protein BJF80_14595 [Serinicoccus sp. CUA-874]
MSKGIGARVSQVLPSGTTQKEVAASVGMTPDAFSRALKGERGFSAIELANLADVLNQDVHYLITGEPDPRRLVPAARHAYDRDTRERSVDSYHQDRQVLDDIALAYHQAGECAAQPSTVPTDLAEARERLGDDFVRVMLERLEGRCGIDVVRVPELTTSYSFCVGERAVIAIPAKGNWFRENWDMAHELAHHVLGHADVIAADGKDVEEYERQANKFAAELLLPQALMDSLDWASMTPKELADQVWVLGVSTQALSTRLTNLRVAVSQQVNSLLQLTTQALLRRHWTGATMRDEITERIQAASARHFPLWIQEAHLDRIAEGSARKGTLAWMLGVAEDALEVDAPEAPKSMAPADLEKILS